MVTKDNNGFKLKTAEWKGYVQRALEDIDETQAEILNKINSIDSRLNHLSVKVAGIGGTAGVLTTLIILILREVLLRR